MAFDFAALNAVRHSRNRTEGAGVPVAPAGSKTAKAEMIHTAIHKATGVIVAAAAGAADTGGFWSGGMPEIGSGSTGVGLDALGGFGLSLFELFATWKGMKLGYGAPMLSGAADGLLFYWAGKQGQLWGKAKSGKKTSIEGSPASTGFNYALEGKRDATAASTAGTQSQFAFDPLHGFAAQ